ncbi:MAG: UDP-N-acetylmuramoyl-L-alanyl-D-glutamate--2,6-diaminopimelate ligase [Kiritimatiellia bacterium]
MMIKAETILAATEVVAVHGDRSEMIRGLTLDSRQVKPGFVFFAVPGHNLDGGRFIQDAIERGARMVVTAEAGSVNRRNVLVAQVSDVRRAMAEMAAAFYDHPSHNLYAVGITGTNGKTTTAGMVRRVFERAERQPGSIGTIRYQIGDRSIPAARTTPESLDLQRMMAQMLKAGCRSVIMEVSSHGLVQKRVWDVDFDVVVFTNLTHDHLDYHQTVEDYYEAKSLLFQGLQAKPARAAVINLDDPWGVRLVELARRHSQVVTYAIQNEKADIRATQLELSAHGSAFELQSPWGAAPARLRLLGRFNVYNALAAMGVCAMADIPLDRIVPVLADMRLVEGRLEEIKTSAGFQVFVDYAHTADALKNVLATLREITDGRLIVVFGCGGDRDRRKRPMMGAVAAELADYSILTSDNPRKENPLAILSQIRAGFTNNDNYEVVEDRYEAIVHALSMADRGDVVLVAGKGHENYQEFGDTVIPFDDRQVVRECLGITTQA